MERDKYQSVTVSNDFQAEFNDIKLNNVNFMPYYEIRLIETIDPDKFDIYDSSY